MKVSICCICYNQEKFILLALDGFLMQKTDFDFDIVIGEDCSTDNTLQIIRSYRDKYVDKIKLHSNSSNIGMMENFSQTLKACHGKYIALCEGDDYWTDPYKLQKQVDFLEANRDYALSFHDAKIIDERSSPYFVEKYSDYEWNNIDYKKDIYGLSDLLSATLCPTGSVVFRKPDKFILPDWFTKLPFGDMPLFILVTGNNKIKFFKETWSVYRRHSASASAVQSRAEEFIKGKISMYIYLYETLPIKQKKEIPKLLKKYIRQLHDVHEIGRPNIKKIRKKFPRLYYYLILSKYIKLIKSI